MPAFETLKPTRTPSRTLGVVLAATMSVTTVAAAQTAHAVGSGGQTPGAQDAQSAPSTNELDVSEALGRLDATPFNDTIPGPVDDMFHTFAESVRVAARKYHPILRPGTVRSSRYLRPHHDYPALDIAVATGTPYFAVADGRAYVINDNRCGKGYVVSGTDGARYVYCHGSRHFVTSGSYVKAGTVLGLTGSTGRSTGPHMHFQVRYNGKLRCPQGMAHALATGATPPPVWSLPTGGCSY